MAQTHATAAAAIARPYAAAAYKHAQENGTVDSWQQVLTNMAAAAVQLRGASIRGKLINDEQTAEIMIVAASSAVKVDEQQKRFARLLAESGRVSVMEEIIQQFNARAREAAGILMARIETAMPMPAAERDSFNRHLEQRLGKKIAATYHENPDLLGGARVYIDDNVIDGSIRGRLQRLEAALKTGPATAATAAATPAPAH